MDYQELTDSVKEFLAAEMKANQQPKSIDQTAEVFAKAIVFAIEESQKL